MRVCPPSIAETSPPREAVRWALACAVRYRIPEPTRLANILAELAKREKIVPVRF